MSNVRIPTAEEVAPFRRATQDYAEECGVDEQTQTKLDLYDTADWARRAAELLSDWYKLAVVGDIDAPLMKRKTDALLSELQDRAEDGAREDG